MENIKRVRWLLEEKLGLNTFIVDYGNEVLIGVRSSLLRRFLEDVVGRGARNKRVPEFIMDAKEDVIRGFLRGLILGDGCIISKGRAKGEYRIKTSSEKLARDIQLLLWKLGIAAGLNGPYERKGDSGLPRYEKGNEFWNIHWKEERKHSRYIEDDKFFYFPVLDSKRIPFEGYVYNIQTSENIYLVPFIVHNCGIDAASAGRYLASMLTDLINKGRVLRLLLRRLTG